MKFKILWTLSLFFAVLQTKAQTQLITLERAGDSLSFPVATIQIIKPATNDTSYAQVYKDLAETTDILLSNLEVKNDSICIIADTCLIHIPGLVGQMNIFENGGSYWVHLYDQFGNEIAQAELEGVIKDFWTENDGSGVITYVRTKHHVYSIPRIDGFGIDVKYNGGNIIYDADSTILATQYDLTQINVNDADSDPANEYNTSIILNGTDLETTDGGGTISTDLSSLQDGAGYWIQAISDIHYNAGNVGINNASPTSPLHILSSASSSDNMIRFGAAAANYSYSSGIEFLESTGKFGEASQYGARLYYDGAANTFKIQMGNTTAINNALSIARNTGAIIAHDDFDINGNTHLKGLLNDENDQHTAGSYLKATATGIDWAIMDYTELTGAPTAASLNYWTQTGADLYYNTGKIGIGLNNPSYELHVSGRIGLSGLGGVFVGNGVGNETMTGGANLGFGDNNLLALTTGFNNLSFGSNSMRFGTTANNNISIGNSSLYNSNGSYSIALGTGAGYYLDGLGNIALGRSTLDANTSGNYNIAQGYQTLSNNTIGSNNIALGFRAGYNNILGSSNVFIGPSAGYNATGSNELWIENTTTSTYPLIWANFSTNDITFNANALVSENLEVTGHLTVTDNLEGDGINLAAYDSNQRLTRMSKGTGLTISGGTISADLQNQSFASATMVTIESNGNNYPVYDLAAMNAVRYETTNVDAQPNNERFEINETAYYNIKVKGAIATDGTPQSEAIKVYIKVGSSTYTEIGILFPRDGYDSHFELNQEVLLFDNDLVVLAFKHVQAGQGVITASYLEMSISKI